MNLLSVINAVTACFFSAIGLYAFLIHRKSIIHQLFSLTCLSLALWSFCALYIFSSADKETAILFYKISCIGFFFQFSLNLHFCIQLSGFKINIEFYILLYLLPLLFSIMTFIDYRVYVDFVRHNDAWVITFNNKSLWNMAYFLYSIITIILCIVCLILWNINSILKIVKKQSFLLILGNVSYVILPWIFTLISIHLFKENNLRFSPLFPIFWVSFAFYAIMKYQFLSLTPDKIRSNILTKIDDLVIFINQDYKIMTVNERVENALEMGNSHLTGKDAREIIENFNKVEDEIKNIEKKDYDSFSCRINFLKKDNEKILMDAKVTRIKDKFHDTIGILIISQEVKELKQFKAFYKITDREAQIIENVIYGKTNKEMSEILNISENTIKTHIVNIYNKLCVNNRMELLNLIKDFNLYPTKSADKTLLFLNRDN